MSLFGTVKDHTLIGGVNALSGWGLLVLLVLSQGISSPSLGIIQPRPGVDLYLFLAVLAGAAFTGNGVYALNAYYDIEIDKVNKPKRPLPSGRMKPEHALRYAIILMVLGMLVAAVVSISLSNPLMLILWTIFTLLGIAYTTPPVKLKARHIYGNLCFGTFAVLAFFIGMIVRPWIISDLIQTFIVYSFFILYVAGIITMKDFSDYEGDKKNGDITLPVKFGRRKAAAISIGIMAIPTVVFSVMWPSTSIVDWIYRNWGFLVVAVSFIVYIALDYVGRDHVLSNSYSKVIYFYVILTAAYGFIRGSVLPKYFLDLMGTWERFIQLAIYVIVATFTVLQSSRKEKDILQPT